MVHDKGQEIFNSSKNKPIFSPISALAYMIKCFFYHFLDAMTEIEKFFHSFFGDMEDKKKFLWDFLTFIICLYVMLVCRMQKLENKFLPYWF